MLRIEGLCKAWEGVSILDGLDLSVDAGQHTRIMGPSGSGKSTLLYLVARLAQPDAGQVLLDGKPVSSLGDAAHYRLAHIGLVFQDVHLLESLSVRDNVQMVQALSPGESIPIADLVEPLGLGAMLDRPVCRLSRGERQRVALARAFANRPRLVLADEPTASLDPASRDQCLDQLFGLADRTQATVLLVSHDPGVADRSELGQGFTVHNRGLIPLTSIRETGSSNP
jgi:ABC-type lipoprotein export system ATPase subunit